MLELSRQVQNLPFYTNLGFIFIYLFIFPVIPAGRTMLNFNTHPQKATWHQATFNVPPRQQANSCSHLTGTTDSASQRRKYLT